MVHIHNGILFSHKKSEHLSFVTAWRDLEGSTLCEISQTEKDKSIWFHLYVGSKEEIKWTNKIERESQIQGTTDWWLPVGRGGGARCVKMVKGLRSTDWLLQQVLGVYISA